MQQLKMKQKNKKVDFLACCCVTNFEIWKYYPNEPKFNGVYSKNNLPKKRMVLMW